MNGNYDSMGNSSRKGMQESGLGMKWHKFLIYFLLWVGALLNITNGVLYFTGKMYGDEAMTVYRMYPGLAGADKIMGVLCFACVVLQLVTRFALAGYKANSPKLLMGTYALGAASSVLYCILADAAIPQLTFSGVLQDMLGTVVSSVFMIVVNHVYYNKREALFVN